MAALILTLGVVAWAAHGETHVLILNSYQKGYGWTDDTVAGLEGVFREHIPGAMLSVEYMDTKRVSPTPAYFDMLAELYIAKYTARRPDVVVVSDNNALTFIMAYHEKVFADVPVVFCGVNNFTDAMIANDPAITGVVEEPDMAGTIELMLKIHPATQRIHVLYDDTPTGLQNVEMAREAARRYEGRVDFNYLYGPDRTFGELLDILRGLGPEELILYLDMFHDSTGEYLQPDETARTVVREAARPVYTHSTVYVGQGTVGGEVASAQLQGQVAAELALRVLRGTPAREIPIIRECPTLSLFDQAALDRWGINPDQLPAGSMILNRRVSFYERYRGLVWGVALTVFVLSVVVVVLLVNTLQRYRAEQALRNQKRLLNDVLVNIPHYIYWKDHQGRFLGCNRKVLEFLGLDDVAQVVGKNDEEAGVDRRWVNSFRESDVKVLETGEPVMNIEQVLEGPKGEDVILLTSKMPLKSDQGDVTGVLGVSLDVTAPRRLEQRLSESEKMRALGQLAGGIAHDFNNVLVAVQGNAQLLLDAVDPASEKAELAREVLNACHRAAGLTKKLLGFARKGRMQDEFVDLQQTIEDVASLLTHSFDRRIHIRCDLRAPRAIVRGDASQLHSAILNLAVNARDAMPRGGTLTFQTQNIICDGEDCDDCESCKVGRECIAVAVSDTGTGIDEAIQDRIFEPFFTTKDPGEGTGLGLAAVYGCAQSHHGSIRLQSKPGEGTTFTFAMPLAEEVPSRDTACRRLPTGDGHVLIIDDEEPIRQFATRALKNLGYTIEAQADGAGGLAYFREHHQDVDVVMLDMVMPRLAGADVLRKLRDIRSDIPVCICSGYSKINVGDLLNEYDNVAFIAKPFSIDELGSALRELIDARDGETDSPGH